MCGVMYSPCFTCVWLRFCFLCLRILGLAETFHFLLRISNHKTNERFDNYSLWGENIKITFESLCQSLLDFFFNFFSCSKEVELMLDYSSVFIWCASDGDNNGNIACAWLLNDFKWLSAQFTYVQKRRNVWNLTTKPSVSQGFPLFTHCVFI